MSWAKDVVVNSTTDVEKIIKSFQQSDKLTLVFHIDPKMTRISVEKFANIVAQYDNMSYTDPDTGCLAYLDFEVMSSRWPSFNKCLGAIQNKNKKQHNVMETILCLWTKDGHR